MEQPGERAGANLSFWERTAQKFYTKPLTENLTADVCIIGAGIAGVTTAYLLAREGRDVVLIDDGPVGGGMTGRTTAHLVNALDDRYYELEKILGQEFSRLSAESHTAAIDQVEAELSTIAFRPRRWRRFVSVLETATNFKPNLSMK